MTTGRAGGDAPAPGAQGAIEGVGLRVLPDGRRVDVAVDLAHGSPGRGTEASRHLELAIESPSGRHVCGASLVHCVSRTADLILHLRGELESGEYTLHVGLFAGRFLVHHEQRRFSLPDTAEL